MLMFSGGRLVDVLSADVLPMPLCLNGGTSCCRRPPLRRYFAAVGCNLGLCPATCVGAGNPKRHWAIPRDAERRSGRASATKHGPSRIVQFLWLRVLWLGKSAHQTDACLILRDPNQFATRGNNFHSTKALFRGFSVPSSVCFRSAAEARRMPILIVIVMWMSKTIHGALHRLERTRGGVVIKPCEISVF